MSSIPKHQFRVYLSYLIIAVVYMVVSPYTLYAKVYTKSEECRECHEDIYKEWLNTPHARAWIDPVFKNATKSYEKEKCLACHSPEPVLESGTSEERILRSEHRKDGVDCLSCHKNKGRQMGSHSDKEGECNPGFSEKVKSGEICFSCHKTETREWKESAYFKKGVTCITCHMEKVVGEYVKGKRGEYAEHRWSGGRNPLYLESVMKDINLTKKGDILTVSFIPFNVGHNFPTGTSGNPSFHIIVVVKNSSGDVVKLFRKNFVKRYKDNGKAAFKKKGAADDMDEERDTSVPPNQKVELNYRLPVKNGMLDFIVFYKRYSYIKDRESVILKNILFEFDEE